MLIPIVLISSYEMILQMLYFSESFTLFIVVLILTIIVMIILVYLLLRDEEEPNRDAGSRVNQSTDDEDSTDTDSIISKLIKEIGFSSCDKEIGGMADIYICDDPRNHRRKVVVKFPKINVTPDDQPTIDYRFDNEIKHHQKLKHPNIVPFLEDGKCKHPFSEQETPYLIQDFIDGCTLNKIINGHRSPLSQSIIFELTTQILDALEYIYKQEVIHRDLSWNNIMVDRTGRLYLIDFGNSTTLEQLQTEIANQGSSSSKRIRLVVPPHPFRAPDDIENRPNTRARDLYALAMLVYLMYGGSFPHNDYPANVRKEVKRNLEKMLNVPDHVKETLKDCLQGNCRTVIKLRANLRLPRDYLCKIVQNIVNQDKQAPTTKVVSNGRDQNTTHPVWNNTEPTRPR